MSSTKATTVGLDRVIGQRVRTARLEAKKSQNDLGVAIGVTFQQIQKYEKGTNRVSTSAMHEIAKVLQKPISYFIEDGPYKPNEHGIAIAEFMATPLGQKLVSCAMILDETLQQTLVDIARRLATTMEARPKKPIVVRKKRKEHA